MTDKPTRPKPGSEPAAWFALQALTNPHADEHAAHVWDDAILTAMRTILEMPQPTPASVVDVTAVRGVARALYVMAGRCGASSFLRPLGAPLMEAANQLSAAIGDLPSRP